ncbi:type II toxin-antitoxin system RelE/ParE family toxin [Mucilaginibacter sp. BJC16-A38]|uniref:type II toxin-antitoxin system RelE/ParE family toxin n=1 Tax=Mucilaginibacter phenanthrenivorans TaxID=1234842 RepID=UPI00358F4B3B|nr:type II toxin-antitoxin system RelE/ParE family toxin [Mucilaginibacter phenanthrenivorans]
MSLQIYYTPRSKETLSSVYNFILGRFGKRSADKFILKAEKTISLIAEFPLMFKASSIDENVRIGLITKQTSLFYLVKETSIDLLFFWDNRQEPVLPSLL